MRLLKSDRGAHNLTGTLEINKTLSSAYSLQSLGLTKENSKGH